MAHKVAVSPPRVRDWLVEKLSRVTTSGEVIREIDGFRFLAITTVVIHHILRIYLESSQRFQIPALKDGRLSKKKAILCGYSIRLGWRSTFLCHQWVRFGAAFCSSSPARFTPTEIQFYLIAPFLTFLFRVRNDGCVAPC